MAQDPAARIPNPSPQEPITVTAEATDDAASSQASAKDAKHSAVETAPAVERTKAASQALQVADWTMSVPTDDRRIRWFGFWLVLLLFGVCGGWAAVAQLDSAVVAPALVTVEYYRKTVQHLEGGIVREIAVRDGDVVNVGDVLMRLDDTQARAELEIVLNQFLASRTLEIRLMAERDQADAIKVPDDLKPYMNDPRAVELFNAQKRLFEARRNAVRGEIAVLEQRIGQLQERIRGLEDLSKSTQKRIALYNDEIVDLRKLFERGLGDKMRLRMLERDAAEMEGNLAEQKASMASSRIQIGETQLQIAQIKKQFLTDVVAELRNTQTQTFDLQERMRALRDKLARTEIRAPSHGSVVGLVVHTEGAVIGPGTPLLEIVPKDENLVIEAQLQPTDVDKVRVGQSADVRFVAFSQRTTPVVTGQVVNVSADRLVDRATNMPYFLTRILVPEEEMKALKGLDLVPGMPAEVIIKTGKRTLLDYLMRPLTDGLARAFRED